MRNEKRPLLTSHFSFLIPLFMFLKLHRLIIELRSRDTAVNAYWRHLLDGWLVEQPQQIDIRLCLEQVPQLPPLPSPPPIFTDERPLPDDVGILTVYTGESEPETASGQVWLHYHDGALVSVPLSGDDDMPTIQGYVTEKALGYGRFEDVTFTSLAPLLRQRGYFLIHAFAASKDDTAVLIVGPSGSGKTTTGLNLLLNGWQLLANDILLLEKREEGIVALPTPGGISIRPQTFELLPALRQWLPGNPSASTKIALTGQQLTGGRWAEPAHASLILFPHLEEGRLHSQLQPVHRAVALVRLLEESADRWDKATLDSHLNVLQLLAEQTAVYNLLLGEDVGQLPGLIERHVKRKM
jgi:hypothetical protein